MSQTAAAAAPATQPPEGGTPPALHASHGALMLGALGVVYGDIGTSPLYTLKGALDSAGNQAVPTVLGLLSLIVWTLILIVSVKYVIFVMRADNDGEGGILALMARLAMKGQRRPAVVAIGILGAAMLYGDGAITPAITVLSAIEGLKLPMPGFAPYVVATSVLVLLALFASQHRGTHAIGRLFGPVMVVWFLVIALLGTIEIFREPSVLLALDPRFGLSYLFSHGLAGLAILGAVFLCATGAEALYADMGHFGAGPIRTGWYYVVLPSLFLSYAGQCALVLRGQVPPEGNPFFLLAPGWMQIPLVILATAAGIIASQAIISGAYSMTRQAIQLDLCPRLTVTQTSDVGYGQIYIGVVNWLLMIFTLALTIGFGSSDNLQSAYGIAVAVTMLLTTLLLLRVMHEQWKWGLPVVLLVAVPLFVVDLSFAGANLTKVREGGWVPLAAASIIFFLMQSWRSGRTAMMRKLERETFGLDAFVGSMADVTRVPGTAIYLARRPDVVPLALLHSLKHYTVLHERNIILHVITEQVPRVPVARRCEIAPLGPGFFRVGVHFGFMETPDIPAALENCRPGGQGFEMMRTTFFLSRETVEAAHGHGLRSARRRIFVWMHRNATDATEFFRLPRNRIVELGARIEV
jgi:KUP system potassium uptake protein